MGCLLSIVSLPFRFVAGLFKTWKWYVACGILAVITMTTTQTSTIPSDIMAPYLVKTSSLYYYAGKVTVAGADYVLTPYWYFNSSSDQWVKSASLTITPNYGKVTVTKR